MEERWSAEFEGFRLDLTRAWIRMARFCFLSGSLRTLLLNADCILILPFIEILNSLSFSSSLAQGAARELFGAARTMRAPQVIYRRILRRIVSEKKGFLRGSEDGFSVGNMTI